MEERNDGEKLEEIMLPGFRFHPTDEELVGFYLKRKIQQRPLSIELIRQLDIYKYDPWDLPKLATTGEKEWYFYCPRDRKYRNSARPNRVTGAGFWKATGTDRPIYSSEGTKCIGLKKSLVFYKGRAAKGIKTDWMMHEFRLPSLTDSLLPHKKFIDKTIPANDAWAICRIFKKTNSTAQRALSHSFVSPLPETSTTSDHGMSNKGSNNTQFSSDSISILTTSNSSIHFNHENIDHHIVQQPVPAAITTTTTTTLSPLDHFSSSYKPLVNPKIAAGKPSPHHQLPISSTGDLTRFMFSPLELSSPPVKSTVDLSSMLLNMSSASMLGDYSVRSVSEGIDFGAPQGHQCDHGFSMTFPLHDDHQLQENANNVMNVDDHQMWQETVTRSSVGFPPGLISLPVSVNGDHHGLRPNFLWDPTFCPT